MVRGLAAPELSRASDSPSGPGRLAVTAAGLGLVALPFSGVDLALVEGAPTLVAAAGISAVLLAASRGTRFARSGAWAALAVVGQAAALQMIRAGSAVGYQHFRVPPRLESPGLLFAAAIVLLQTVVVVVAVARHRSAIRHRLSVVPGGWRLALVVAAFVLTAATLSPTVPVYLSELALAAAVQAVNAATLAAAAAALPGDLAGRAARWISGGAGAGDVDRRPSSLLPLGAALWVVGVTVLLSVVAYQRHPHIADELVYLLQARYLAAGRLALPVPPVPEAFELDLMFLDGGRWYSPVPPGWPAVLAVGAFLGTPWLVNPILAGISVWLAYRLLADLYDDATARIGTLLLALSPWLLFLSMGLMNHTLQLAAVLGGAVALTRLRETGRLRWAAIGGVAVGMVALVRPLDGLIAGLVLGGWSLAFRGERWRFAPTAVFGVAAAAAILPLAAYNLHFTGDPTVFPIMEYTRVHYGAGSNALGFGPERGLGWGGFDPFPGHDLLDALINTNLNAFALNVELFGWSAGSLLPAFLLLAFGGLRRTDLAMLSVVVLVVGIHGLYWSSGGPDFGPRYWSLAFLPCVALTARAVPLLGRLLGPAPSSVPDDGARERAAAGRDGAPLGRGALLLGLAAFSATVTFVPWRAVDKYHGYRGMVPDVRTLAEERDFGEALVLVRGKAWPDYASAAVYNPLDLRAAAPVYAWDRSPEVRREILAAYPAREAWIVEGPTLTGDGYRVVGRLDREGGPP